MTSRVDGHERISQEQLDALVGLHNRFLEGRIGGRRAHLENTDLSGLSLQKKKLSQANFTGCIMSDMDLSFTDFDQASLYACNLSRSNLYQTSFVRSDLRGARIEDANLEGADLESADLRVGGIAGAEDYAQPQAVNFRGANLSGAKLVGSMASKADFSDAMMVGANVSNADLQGASLEGADLSNADIGGAQLEGANISSAILTGIELSSLKKQGIDLSEAITDENVGQSVADLGKPLPQLLEDHKEWLAAKGKTGAQLDLTNVDLRMLGTLKMERMTAIKALKAKFFGMNLYKLQLQSALLDGSDFRKCDMEEADLRGSSFKSCNFSHASLKAVDCSALLLGAGGTSRFSPCDFAGAKMRYVDFTNAVLKDALFIDADLAQADFTGADLSNADFTGAKLDGAKLDEAITTDAKFDRDESRPVFKMREEKEG